MESWVPPWIEPLLAHPVDLGRTLFLSDLHFGCGIDEVRRREEFLAVARRLPDQIDDLVLGGDVFEFWWEWKHALPRGFDPLLEALGHLVRNGVRLRMIRGNHDFALGEGISGRTGATIHPDGFMGRIQGRNWLFLHGDACMAPERTDRVLRRIMRSRWAQAAWNALPADLSFATALGVGRGSRSLDDGCSPHTALMEPQMRIWLRRFGLRGVVHGHSHRALVTETADGTYANNGDWVRQRTGILLVDGGAQLLDFAGKDHAWPSNT